MSTGVAPGVAPYPPTLPPRTVFGRLGTVAGPGQAIPLGPALDPFGDPFGMTAVKLVDFNTVGDTDFAITLPPGVRFYRLNSLYIYGATGALNTAHFAVYSGAGATGLLIVNDQACTITTGGNNAAATAQFVSTNINAGLDFATLRFRITTPQGVPATAWVYLLLQYLP